MWHSGRRQRLKSYIAAPITAHLVAWSLAAVLAMAVSAATAFYFGYDYGLNSVGASAGEVQQLRQATHLQQQQLTQLKTSIITLQQDKDIALQTAQKLQQDNKEQLASVADMQEQILQYQRLLGAKGSANPLTIDNVSLKKAADNRFLYRVLLTQVSNNKSDIAGKVTIRVLGHGKSVNLNPTDFQFQYFKSVTGEIVLPAGFQAESLEVTVQALGKKAIRVQKKFKWEVTT